MVCEVAMVTWLWDVVGVVLGACGRGCVNGRRVRPGVWENRPCDVGVVGGRTGLDQPGAGDLGEWGRGVCAGLGPCGCVGAVE